MNTGKSSFPLTRRCSSAFMKRHLIFRRYFLYRTSALVEGQLPVLGPALACREQMVEAMR